VTSFVIRGRQGGKTFEAVRWLREDPDRRVIVTVDQRSAQWIRDSYGLNDRQVVSCDGELRDPGPLQGMPYGQCELAIEDLDAFLARAFAFRVGLVTSIGDCGHETAAPNPPGA
jgi:hypothetical protein